MVLCFASNSSPEIGLSGAECSGTSGITLSEGKTKRRALLRHRVTVSGSPVLLSNSEWYSCFTCTKSVKLTDTKPMSKSVSNVVSTPVSRSCVLPLHASRVHVAKARAEGPPTSDRKRHAKQSYVRVCRVAIWVRLVLVTALAGTSCRHKV